MSNIERMREALVGLNDRDLENDRLRHCEYFFSGVPRFTDDEDVAALEAERARRRVKNTEADPAS